MAKLTCKRCWQSTETDCGTDTYWVCPTCRAIKHDKTKDKRF